jgi:hypothetical protein
MLLPVAENEDLLARFSGTKKVRGLLVIRWSMIQECVLGVTRLVYDEGKQNPTIGNMIEAIRNPPSAPLWERLKTVFAVPIKPTPPMDRSWSDAELKMWAEVEKQETEELRQAFDRYLPKLQEEWDWFESHRNPFKDLRDKRIAHLDTSKVGNDYVPKGVKGPEWGDIKKAIQRLINVAEILLTILHQKDESFGQFVEIAKRDARAFWGI